MHRITEMPAWERLFKRIVWAQIGDLKGLCFLSSSDIHKRGSADAGPRESVSMPAPEFRTSSTCEKVKAWKRLWYADRMS